MRVRVCVRAHLQLALCGLEVLQASLQTRALQVVLGQLLARLCFKADSRLDILRVCICGLLLLRLVHLHQVHLHRAHLALHLAQSGLQLAQALLRPVLQVLTECGCACEMVWVSCDAAVQAAVCATLVS